MTRDEFLKRWRQLPVHDLDMEFAADLDAVATAEREDAVRELRPPLWVGPGGAVDLAKTVAAAREEQREVDKEHAKHSANYCMCCAAIMEAHLTATPLADEIAGLKLCLEKVNGSRESMVERIAELMKERDALVDRALVLEARLAEANRATPMIPDLLEAALAKARDEGEPR